uniref:Furin-like protease 2 n=1 Tax=Heterorhabditis bacteriophora TaxID=37862 RepID=A0A1I7XHE3_HETBA
MLQMSLPATFNTDRSESIAFGDLTSVGDCHEECQGGCTEPRSAVACFSCRNFTQTLRNKAGNGFKCVQRCDDTYYLDGDKCKMCSPHCHSCTKSEICETCPGSQLLIDVNHFGQLDHGKCVDHCPSGLVADYESNLVQARCILREEKCGEGYYLDALGKCGQCDGACVTCHGPGSLNCDTCAGGYGNRSTGYCRECCTEGQDAESYHCEDCSLGTVYAIHGQHSSSFFWSLIWIMVIVFIIIFVGLIAYYFFKDEKDQIDYTPLPHYNSATGDVHLLDSDSDSDDAVFESKLSCDI